MTPQVAIPLMITAGVAILAGLVDFARFRIPNRITVPFLVCGLVYHGVTGGLEGLWYSGGGCLVCFLVVLVLYLMGAMGAGDVKFMAGIGAWLGVHAALFVFLIAALATGLYSMIVMVWQGGLGRLVVALNVVLCQIYRFKVVAKHLAGVESIESIINSQDRRRRLVPFGAMLAGGVLAVVFWKSFFPT